MRIRAGFEITFECPAPTPMWLSLSVHPSRQGDLETPDQLRVDPHLATNPYRDGFGNLCTRLVAPAGRLTLSSDFVIRDSGLADEAGQDAPETPLDRLPPETLVYLLGSRYCETDRLSDLAWRLFGGTPPGERRVEAVIDFVHRHIAFDYNQARATRTAYEAYEERCGVCRDYAHLAIAFCRCLNLPARYCTGYLGDIGVEPLPFPGDFSAWFEVFLDGRWRTFDARHAEPRIGRILVAHGRDATDTAISTAFGPNRLIQFNVFTDELAEARPRLVSV